MPTTTNLAKRTSGHVDKGSANTSATTSIGSRGKSFAARKRDLTVDGGAPATATVTLSKSSFTLASTTGTVQLTATATNAVGDHTGDEQVTASVSWASSSPSNATVSSTGLVTGVLTGSSNISCTIDGVTSGNCAITVP